jgi:hypothetical protein
MNTRSPNPSSETGFRFSMADGLVLLLALAATVQLWRMEIPLWWLLIVVLGHFFLVCNVFLVWRKYELIWALIFIVNVGTHVLLGRFHWLSPCLFQLPVTVTVILLQIRSPHYRGVFAQAWNRLQ